jgi:WD40 repeat protein
VYLYDLDPKRPGAPVPETVRGPSHDIHGVAFGPDGSRLITLDGGGAVKQWDPAARAPRLHTPFGWALSRGGVFPNGDGSRVALIPTVTNADRRFRLQTGDGRLLGEMDLPPGHPDFADFSADGRTFALVWHPGYEFTVHVWDAVAGKEICRLSPPPGMRGVVALSPDGSRVAVTTTTAPNEGGWSSSTLQVWETATGREILSRRGLRTEDVFVAAFSADGRHVFINPGLVVDGDVRIVWLDVQSGKEAATLKLGNRMLRGGGGSRDGKLLALAHRDGETTAVSVWQVERILRGENPDPDANVTGLGGDVTRIDFSPDGRRMLTSGDGGVKLWDLASGHEVLALKADGAMTGQAYFSPDGHTIWGGLDEHGRLWGWDGTPVAEERP